MGCSTLSIDGLNDLKEQFSYSYVSAVTTAAGYVCSNPTHLEDNLGIDLTIRKRSRGRKKTRAALDVQVKCSSVNSSSVSINDKEIKFDLDVDNYIELIKPESIPQILVLMLVPEDFEKWLCQLQHRLVMRKCAYYKTFESCKETKNTSKIRISIPSQNVFSPVALKKLLK